jgi:hypothetical protein
MPKITPRTLSPELALERVLTMRDASEITGLSTDTLERRYPHLIVRLSPRRKGIPTRRVLEIARGQALADAGADDASQ